AAAAFQTFKRHFIHRLNSVTFDRDEIDVRSGCGKGREHLLVNRPGDMVTLVDEVLGQGQRNDDVPKASGLNEPDLHLKTQTSKWAFLCGGLRRGTHPSVAGGRNAPRTLPRIRQ